jgi:hypothetical protein
MRGDEAAMSGGVCGDARRWCAMHCGVRGVERGIEQMSRAVGGGMGTLIG